MKLEHRVTVDAPRAKVWAVLMDLPAAARRYLDRLQEMVETPITYVSVGTRRDQIIGL